MLAAFRYLQLQPTHVGSVTESGKCRNIVMPAFSSKRSSVKTQITYEQPPSSAITPDLVWLRTSKLAFARAATGDAASVTGSHRFA